MELNWHDEANLINSPGPVLLFLSVGLIVQGGAVYDWGTVGLVEGNYLAWVSTATPPIQVLTEDGYNPGGGVNQGFIAGGAVGTWLLDVGGGFANPAALPNGNVEMLFGGLGGNIGTIVKYNFAWDSVGPTPSMPWFRRLRLASARRRYREVEDTDGKVINGTLTGQTVTPFIVR